MKSKVFLLPLLLFIISCTDRQTKKEIRQHAAAATVQTYINQIKKDNPMSIKFLCIIAAPEGMEALQKAHPDVDIICAALDDHLNEHKYIVPGLGDAGDRIFGTK